MIELGHNKFGSIVRKYCPNYELFIRVLSSVEERINNDIPDRIIIQYGLKYIENDIREQIAVFIIQVDDISIFRQEYRFTKEVNLDFMRAANQLWITEVNNFFFNLLVNISAIGISQLNRICKNEITNEIIERDIISL